MKQVRLDWCSIGIALAMAGCGGPAPSTECTDCREITAFEGTRSCSVAIRGYHYIAAPMESIGGNAERAMRLAVSDINAAGGVHGKPLGLVLCSTNADDTQAVAIMEEVAAVPEISATTCCSYSFESIPAAAVAARRGIMMVSPSATSPALTTIEDDGYFARTVPPDTLQGSIAAAYAHDTAARVFVAANTDPYADLLATEFIRAFTDLGGQAMRVDYAQEGDAFVPSPSAVLDDAMAYGPELVFLSGFPRDANALISTASDRGFVVPWLMSDGVRSPEFLTGVNLSYVQTNVQGTAPSPAARWFLDAFETAWGETPDTFNGSLYDATFLLAAGMEIAADPDDRAAVRDAVLTRTQVGARISAEMGWAAIRDEIASAGQVDYHGASGPVDFDAQGDVTSTYAIWGVRGGEFVNTACRTPDNTACE